VDGATTTSDTTSRGPGETQELRGPVLDVLRVLLAEFEGREQILAIVGRLIARNTELEQQLAKTLFKKCEQVSTAQLLLALGALGLTGRGTSTSADDDRAQPEVLEDADSKLRQASGIDDPKPEDATKTPRPPRQPRTRTPAPAHLERIPNPIPVPAAERACPSCGAERVCIGHEPTEVIDLIPAKVFVRVDLREKLVCRPCEGEHVRAPLPDKVVAGGKLGLVFVAQLLVDKYVDGLPLHRQRERYARLGIDLSVSTLCDQVKWSTDLLKPLWRAALDEVIAARVMHVDGTGLPVLDPAVAGGKRLGTLWGYVGADATHATAAYVYTSTGKKVGQKPGELGPQDVLARREGPTVADASNVFDASFKRPGLIECGCNMHGRRYWIKALDTGDQRAALPIAAYKKLYQIEDEIKDRDPDAKLAERVARSKPVFDELIAWCQAREAHEPPSSKLGTAIRYMLNNRVALGRFLEDGNIPIDNGAVERLHIRAALSRKNFLFAGADSGGDRAAIAFTIFGSCRLAGVDPIEYLSDILPRLTQPIRLSEVSALLPAAWKARREAAAKAAAEAPVATGPGP
jgi:transposase